MTLTILIYVFIILFDRYFLDLKNIWLDSEIKKKKTDKFYETRDFGFAFALTIHKQNSTIEIEI